jgi:hypothetical protein
MEPYKVPNLPGFIFHDPRKEDHRVGQYMKRVSGLMHSRGAQLGAVNRQIDEHTRTITLLAPTMQLNETFATEHRLTSEEVPATYDPVLRFYAYFRETVPESNEEERRVRYVRIHVFLEDDTIMIEEYRLRNSGIEQGVLLKRMRPLNPQAQLYGTQYVNSDFQVGTNVEIYGVVYRIYSCDQFTEDYLRSIGRDVGAFEEPPDDLYSIKRRLTDRPIRVTRIDTDKTHLRQFLDFDGKVLRFYATWDDTASLFGEKRNFVFHYFLVDDTIEIRQILPPNSGRDPVSRFLQKTKLVNPETGKFYTDQDLHIGAVIDVHGRNFLLFDADDWTRQFLDNKWGPHDWTPIDVDSRRQKQQSQRIFPPYNGWGDEEDSLGYCLSLHPKPPRKDLVKLAGCQGQLLRFAAKFKNPAPQDRFRKFVIVFYLADDTVGVFELPQRNSGFREGQFIQRTKLKNALADGRYFAPADFKLGEEITLNGFTFLTYDADEFALNLMEAEAEEFPQADLVAAVDKMRQNRKGVDKFRMNMESRDKQGRGYVDPAFGEHSIIRIFGLRQHEALTAVRRWTNDWGFDYLGLLAALA